MVSLFTPHSLTRRDNKSVDKLSVAVNDLTLGSGLKGESVLTPSNSREVRAANTIKLRLSKLGKLGAKWTFQGDDFKEVHSDPCFLASVSGTVIPSTL